MAVIGFVRQETMNIKNSENNEVKKAFWLECHFRVAGLKPFKAKLAKNKKKEKENQPDYYFYLRGNINKGDTFRDIRIGSLWIKNKEVKTKNEEILIETYMTGNIEINFKNVNVLIQKPKKYFNDEKIGFLYEIIAFLDDNRQKNNNDDNNREYESYEQTETYYTPDEEMPF